MKAYQYGNFPVFDGFNHMQYQIRNPKGFTDLMTAIIDGHGNEALEERQ